ncbi:hypothetical protein GCM10027396_04390 [Insolitispirillum peregrinum]
MQQAAIFQRRPETAVPLLQHRQHQSILGGEVLVERHSGNAGVCDKAVDARAMETIAIKQGFGNSDQMVAFF